MDPLPTDRDPRSPSHHDRAAQPTVAIVMPAYNAAQLLPRTVTAALAALRGGPLLVVDPGSDDGTPEVAERLGARVLRLGHRGGPAEARNAGVERIETDVVLFIDSDCVAHADVVERVQRAFADSDALVSVTGSYDDTPPETNLFSQYMNLRHHAVHQRAKREDASFWAGCGAVRVSAFRSIGGFDAERFPRPMIEDIELGNRLRAVGATRLDPQLHVTHLKRWTMKSVIVTDVVHRAIPWTRLIRDQGALPDDLNTRTSQRVAALVAPLALLSVPALVVLPFVAPLWTLALPVALLGLSVALNASLFAVFLRRRGPLFAVAAFLFHQFHLFYSAATFVWVSLTHRPRKDDGADGRVAA